MAASVVDSSIYQDARFLALSARARELIFFLLTGHLRRSLPGIFIASSVTLADEMRCPLMDLQASLQEAQNQGLVQVDAVNRVVRLTSFVQHNTCKNHFVLKAWFKDWKALPEASPLCGAHLVTIVPCVPLTTEHLLSTWQGTFGPHLEHYVIHHLGCSDPALEQLVARRYCRPLVLQPSLVQPLPGSSLTQANGFAELGAHASGSGETHKNRELEQDSLETVSRQSKSTDLQHSLAIDLFGGKSEKNHSSSTLSPSSPSVQKTRGRPRSGSAVQRSDGFVVVGLAEGAAGTRTPPRAQSRVTGAARGRQTAIAGQGVLPLGGAVK